MQNKIGQRLSPTLKYWIFLVGIITVIFAVIFGSFAASYLHLTPEEQFLVEELFDKLIPFPFIGAIVLVAFICTMVSLLFRYYIIPVLRMAEQTRLITAANPDYRITPEGARELVRLADVINESADAFQQLQHDVDGKIQASNMALKEERNRLAALMSELPYGVIVCNLDGRVLLYNRTAQEMLKPQTDQDNSGAIGLGRSIFSVLERDPLVHALEVMNHAFDSQEPLKPTLGLMTKLSGSRFIRVNMAPVTSESGPGKHLSGFVLSLEDITGEVNADSERDQLLQEMIDAVQASLGKLHQGINDICRMPGVGGDACGVHRDAIAQVSADLESHLAMARQLYTEHRAAYGNRENVKDETLLRLIENNIQQRFGMQLKTQVRGSTWLKIDSYAILQAITTLAGFLKAEHGLEELDLSISSDGSAFAGLKIQWPGRAIPCQAIEDWLSLPLFMDSKGGTDSPGAIIKLHGGKVTRYEDNGSCRGTEVTLPSALEAEPATLHSAIAPRPVSFEFDLFHQPGQQALGKVPLRNLTYVAFDTETTGLNPSEGDEIIQLGAVRILNGRLLHEECIDQLVNPQRPVPKSSVAIHGIDPDLLPSQPTITEVLPRFHSFVTDSVLVAHNAAFDMRFLQLKQDLAGTRFDNPVLDTLLLSSIVHPNLEGHSLDAIAERFHITIVGRHTALGDALVTAEILLKLIPLLEAQGISTLDEALQACIKSPFAKISY